MKASVILASLIFANQCWASSEIPSALSADFSSSQVVVPLVNGDPTGSDLVSGMLYFNTATSSFTAVDNVGNKITFGSSGNGNIISSATTERMERARLTCGTAAAIITQSGSWLTSVTVGATGKCTINITSGKFSSAPTCSCIAEGTGGGFCELDNTTYSTTQINFIRFAGGSTPTDGNIQILCVGPR